MKTKRMYLFDRNGNLFTKQKKKAEKNQQTVGKGTGKKVIEFATIKISKNIET